MSTDPQAVRDWLKALGAVTANNVGEKEALQRLSAYVPLLVMEFSSDTFTPASLAAVAKRCPFFPSYAELVGHLSAWWSEHKPPVARLPAPDVGEIELRELRESWADADGVRRLMDQCEGDGKLLRFLASLVARYAPQNLKILPRHSWPAGADRIVEQEVTP